MENNGTLTLGRHNDLINYDGYVGSTESLGTKSLRGYVFECHLTVDEKYFILQDEVFDIQEQTTLGNIWDSLDVFKTIFRNVEVDEPEYKEIQEGWESLPLLEGDNNLHALRDFLLEWSFFDDTWVGRQLKSAGTAIKDAAVDTWNGIKSMGIAISKGDWSEILRLLGRGVLWILRKLKSAAYSTLGIIVDAILVATGVGKTAQVVVWGLITALDVYQIINNDWPSGDDRSQFWKYLDLGFDILGLVFAGVAAKGARAIFRPLQGLKINQMAAKVAKSARMKGIVTKIHRASKSAATKLKKVESMILKKWPSGGKFIAKIIGGFGNVMKKLQTYLGKINSTANLRNVDKVIKPGKGFVPTVKTGKEFLKKGAVAGGIAGGLSYGIEKGVEMYTGHSVKDMENFEKTMDNYNELYGDTDPFDTWD